MKRKLLLTLTLFIAIVASSKTTYIPQYYTQITIVKDGVTRCDSTITREMLMNAVDGHYSFTVIHDSVTKERVKAIKNMKAAAGWAAFASVMGGVSAGLNPLHNGRDVVDFMRSREIMVSSAFLNQVTKHEGNSLQHVPINILFENLSDKEMSINDLQRGLIWYVAPHTSLTLKCGNPEMNEFRVAYNDNTEIEYVTIQSGNFLEKENIAYEDEKIWVVENYFPDSTEKTIVDYSIVDKISFERTEISIADYKQFKKEHKSK